MKVFKGFKKRKGAAALAIAAAAALILCLQMSLVSAEEVSSEMPGALIDFTDPNILDPSYGVYNSASSVEYDVDLGYLHIISQNGPDLGGNGDPIMMFHLDQLDADQYCWMKIKLRNYSEVTRFQLHFGNTGVTAASNTLFDISAQDTEFKTYVINLKQANEATFPISSAYSDIGDPEASLWTGEISYFRLDFLFVDFPGGQVPTGSEMDIEYVAFFDSEEAAEAFTNEKPATPTPDMTSTATPLVTKEPEATAAQKTTVPSVTATAGPKKTEEEDASVPTALIIAIAAAAVLVIGGIIVFAVKKNRKKD